MSHYLNAQQIASKVQECVHLFNTCKKNARMQLKCIKLFKRLLEFLYRLNVLCNDPHRLGVKRVLTVQCSCLQLQMKVKDESWRSSSSEPLQHLIAPPFELRLLLFQLCVHEPLSFHSFTSFIGFCSSANKRRARELKE